MSLLMSQLAALGVKSSQPENQFGLLGILSSAAMSKSLLSSAYMIHPRASCLPLFMQLIPWDFVLAFPKAGKSIAARMAMMAMTTSNSINVNADFTEAMFLERPLRCKEFIGGLIFPKVIFLRAYVNNAVAAGIPYLRARCPVPWQGNALPLHAICLVSQSCLTYDCLISTWRGNSLRMQKRAVTTWSGSSFRAEHSGVQRPWKGARKENLSVPSLTILFTL